MHQAEIILDPGDNATRMRNNVDPLRLYFGDPYPIDEDIVIYQPSLEDIMLMGEDNFYQMLFIFIGNTTYRKVFLWDNGIDWNKISDFELFCNLVKMLPVEQTKILFGDIDFQTFQLYCIDDPDPEPELVAEEGKRISAVERNKWNFRLFERTRVFYSEEQDIAITGELYHKIVDVLREMVKIFPKTEYTSSKITKELLIDEERERTKRMIREQGDNATSTLLPLISFCCNHPGFKYKRTELKDVKIYEFMDAVQRLQIYESTKALINGSYSGFADMSKVPKSQFDFMRPITNN